MSMEEAKSGFKWIENSLIEDYGKRKWKRLSVREQLFIIAQFMCDYLGAIGFIKKQRNKTNNHE
jgi:hypothetical protein